MDYPNDPVMLLLMALHGGVPLVVRDGEMELDLGRGVIVRDDALTELETRGWVEHTESGPKPTAAGLYWLKRWVASIGTKRRVGSLPANPWRRAA